MGKELYSGTGLKVKVDLQFGEHNLIEHIDTFVFWLPAVNGC